MTVTDCCCFGGCCFGGCGCFVGGCFGGCCFGGCGFGCCCCEGSCFKDGCCGGGCWWLLVIFLVLLVVEAVLFLTVPAAALLRLLGAFGLSFELFLPLFLLAAVALRFLFGVTDFCLLLLFVIIGAICSLFLVDSISHSLSLDGLSESELDESISSFWITLSRSVSLSR